jgi:hypothetical protein
MIVVDCRHEERNGIDLIIDQVEVRGLRDWRLDEGTMRISYTWSSRPRRDTCLNVERESMKRCWWTRRSFGGDHNLNTNSCHRCDEVRDPGPELPQHHGHRLEPRWCIPCV